MFDTKQLERGADIRGNYPGQVNEELAWFVGRCLVEFLRRDKKHDQPRVLVARDGRLSSFSMYSAMCQAISSKGGVPIPVGLASTDSLTWATGSRLADAVAGAMITASHNPRGDNGIKMVYAAGPDHVETISVKKFLLGIFQQEMKDTHYHAASTAAHLPFPLSPALDVVGKFVNWACDPKFAPDLEKFTQKVIIDPGNGVGTLFLKPLQDRLPNTRLESIFDQLDGNFPNRPSNPGLPGALAELSKQVRKRKAAFGAAFDGDADRLFVVDDNGDFVPGDFLLAALARRFLTPKRADVGHETPPIIFAATCSWTVVQTIRAGGGKAVISKVGQDSVRAAMLAQQAIFGGESSAHFNFRQSFCQDAGMIALMVFWQDLLERQQTASELIKSLDPWARSEEVNIRIESNDWRTISEKAMTALTDRYRELETKKECYISTLDGVSVYFSYDPKVATSADLFHPVVTDASGGTLACEVHPDYTPEYWFNVRRSNNEPLLRLNVECRKNKELEKRLKKLIKEVVDLCEEAGDCKARVEE
jgi:phosphomannomutase